MPNPVIYWTIWFPLLSIGIVFYILTLYVLIKKRKDSILGTSFFKIQIVLGFIEIYTSVCMHFISILPKFGIFVDNFYLLYINGVWAQVFSYLNQSAGPIQYSIISLVSLNRIIVLLGTTKYITDQFNKISKWILISCIFIPLIIYTPIFYWSTSAYVDYRVNVTDISTIKTIAACQILNTDLATVYGTITMACKVSNVIFNILMFITVVVASCKKSGNSSVKNKIRMHEIKLSIAMISLSIIYCISSVLILGIFYFWSAYRNTLLEYLYPIEDTNRMLTPILLFIFSNPLQNAFKEIYGKKTIVTSTITPLQ